MPGTSLGYRFVWLLSASRVWNVMASISSVGETCLACWSSYRRSSICCSFSGSFPVVPTLRSNICYPYLSLQNQRDRPRKIWAYIKTDAAFGAAASVFVFSYVKNTIVICDKSSALEWNSCEKSATKKRHESRVYPRCGKHGWLEDQ